MALSDSVAESEAKFQWAARLFQVGRLSLVQAAEIARYYKPIFIELLDRMGISAIDHDPSELTDDLRYGHHSRGEVKLNPSRYTFMPPPGTVNGGLKVYLSARFAVPSSHAPAQPPGELPTYPQP